MGWYFNENVMTEAPGCEMGYDGHVRLTMHPEVRTGKALNLGCGFTKFIGKDWINTDKYAICNPDVVWDLEVTPYPWDDNEFNYIIASHVFEHLHNWWGAFCECVRLLKTGGFLEIKVPDESATTAITFRDHVSLITIHSFHGTGQRNHKSLYTSGQNAWAKTVEAKIPIELTYYYRVPYKKYSWMRFWPLRYVLSFCANHMRNFIWEQQFFFRKL